MDRYDAAARRFRRRPAAELPWTTKIEEPGVMDLIATGDVIERLDALIAARSFHTGSLRVAQAGREQKRVSVARQSILRVAPGQASRARQLLARCSSSAAAIVLSADCSASLLAEVNPRTLPAASATSWQ